jgi:hypothetical protein
LPKIISDKEILKAALIYIRVTGITGTNADMSNITNRTSGICLFKFGII